MVDLQNSGAVTAVIFLLKMRFHKIAAPSLDVVFIYLHFYVCHHLELFSHIFTPLKLESWRGDFKVYSFFKESNRVEYLAFVFVIFVIF